MDNLTASAPPQAPIPLADEPAGRGFSAADFKIGDLIRYRRVTISRRSPRRFVKATHLGRIEARDRIGLLKVRDQLTGEMHVVEPRNVRARVDREPLRVTA